MRRWSRHSQLVHDQLHPRLQTLVTRLRDEVADITLVYPFGGYRDAQTQAALVEAGASTLRWPDSKHNKYPSQAVDLQPYPRPVEEEKLWGALGYLAGRAFGIAKEEGFDIRWGGDWNGDGDLTNQNFDDLFHIELVDV